MNVVYIDFYLIEQYDTTGSHIYSTNSYTLTDPNGTEEKYT